MRYFNNSNSTIFEKNKVMWNYQCNASRFHHRRKKNNEIVEELSSHVHHQYLHITGVNTGYPACLSQCSWLNTT